LIYTKLSEELGVLALSALPSTARSATSSRGKEAQHVQEWGAGPRFKLIWLDPWPWDDVYLTPPPPFFSSFLKLFTFDMSPS
jgi:hypothetical protein